MPLQKPSSTSISRSKRVRCSMRCASTSFCVLWKKSMRSRSSTLIASMARSVVAGRIHREARHRVLHAAGERIEHLQLLHLVVEQRDADRVLGVLGGEHV